MNRRYRAILSQNIPKPPLSTILDIGCGTGLYLDVISAGALHYLGIDLSIEMLTECRHRVRVSCKDAVSSLLRADASRLPFKQGAVEGVVSIGMVLPHIPSYELGVEEISRVLNDNGRFWIEFDNKWSADLIHYLADALTRGRLSYGFQSLNLVAQYVQRSEYEWAASLDRVPVSWMVRLHKISVGNLKRILATNGLRLERIFGVHFATLFLPKSFPRDSSILAAYMRLVEWLDSGLGTSFPFSRLGGSLIVVGSK